MTAEISVMNKLAVAMAADSAVTVIGKKVYNTGSKIFPVTHSLPIGVMFYGRADLLGVPWETVIASYRKSIGAKRFKTVQECGEHFLKYLATASDLFDTKQQTKFYLEFLRVLMNEHLEKVNQAVIAKLKECGEIKDEDILAIARPLISAELKRWTDAGYIHGVTDREFGDFKKKYADDIYRIASEVFQKLPFDEAMREDFLSLCASYAYRRLVFELLKSGVVFCGFGDDEIYPSLFAAEMDYVIEGRVRYLPPNIHSISHDNGAWIVPFAQKDVVGSFLRGIDPSFFGVVGDFMKTFFVELVDSINKNISAESVESKKAIAVIESVKEKAGSAVLEKLNELSQKQFVGPVIAAVQMLSKDDLAHMAEALVNLTSFRRKISLDLETVGGPVDVAVISKKDGFIWVKRKHYFSPELNPHFFGRNNDKAGV